MRLRCFDGSANPASIRCGVCRTRSTRTSRFGLICWFPNDQQVVVALFAGDKARMGDVFYDSVGSRADAAIEQWKREVQR